jgi:hypothetical protein
MTLTVGRGPTPHQRRESTKERLTVMTAVLDALDDQVRALPTAPSDVVEPHGLRRIVRALLPLGLDDPAFDVTVAVAPGGVGVRVHHTEDGKVTARLVAGLDARSRDLKPQPRPPAGRPTSRVVSELTEALRRGDVRPR